MPRAVKAPVFTAAAALAFSPVQARAEGYISPWVAANAGTGFDGNNLGRSFDTAALASALKWARWQGIIGGELDFGWSPTSSLRPRLRQQQRDRRHGQPHRRHSDWWNSTAPASGRKSRRALACRGHKSKAARSTVSSSNNDLGWKGGGGLMGYFFDHFGLRGDVRYLRNIQNNITADNINFDPGNFHSGEPRSASRFRKHSGAGGWGRAALAPGT